MTNADSNPSHHIPILQFKNRQPFGQITSWLMMSVGMVVMIALLVILVWALIRWFNGRAIPPGERTPMMPSGPSALEILQQRYARGEIDDATYERMRERLQESTVSSPPPWSAPR